MIKNYLKRKHRASGTLEFLVVFVVLFIFFMTITDIGLYFREIYLVQTVSDEAQSKMSANGICINDIEKTKEIFKDTIHTFYNTIPNLTLSTKDGFNSLEDDNYTFKFLCHKDNLVDNIIFEKKYSGLFLFKPYVLIKSNNSSNTLFY